jgi:hypothetical protein
MTVSASRHWYAQTKRLPTISYWKSNTASSSKQPEAQHSRFQANLSAYPTEKRHVTPRSLPSEPSDNDVQDSEPPKTHRRL